MHVAFRTSCVEAHCLGEDENIAPDVVAGLRARGCDVRTAWDQQLIGRPDVQVLEHATSQGRAVVPHDVAFGRSAIRTGSTRLKACSFNPT
ncbi:MAG: DUF5615 family PIN-like protein [Acidobacteria bacterium]|nr:DUF5615 family PIN-like protein [Acidobacteriota bacterium]